MRLSKAHRISPITTGFIVVLLLAIVSSCSLIGINLHSKTPKHEKPYPVFTRADSLRGTLGEYRAWYDVHYYDLNLEVDIEKKHLKGYVDMHFNVIQSEQILQFDLFSNMKINKIEYHGEELKYTREYNAVYVALPIKATPGQSDKIRIYYEGSPMIAKRPPWKGGFVWKNDKNKKPWVGVACEGDGASLWWPLKDHGSDEPDSCGIHITIPKGLFCVANGILESRIVKGEQETFNWKVSYPINRYNVNFSIGDYAHFTVPYENNGSTHELHFYPLSYHLEKAQPHFKQTVSIIKFFEKAFGEYPWWNDDYKLIETPFMGMEHQTAIAYGNKYKNFYYYDFDHIILHETAHEWWGNSLTASDMCDVWLQEGFATYSEALYVEDHYSYTEYQKYLNLYRMMIKNNHPVIGPSGVDYFYFKDTDVYMKGAWFLHTLRSTLADDTLFFDIIKSFATRYRAKTVCTNDFLSLVNEKTGEDYAWLFKQYLYERQVPELLSTVRFDAASNTYRFYYKWTKTRADFRLPVEISGRKINTKRINPTTDWQYLTIGNSSLDYTNRGVFPNTNRAYFTVKEYTGAI